MVIASEGSIVIRHLEEADIPLLAKYANNKKVYDNVRDAFPHPYTTDHAKAFYEAVSAQSPTSIFAIAYCGEYIGNIALTPQTDVYRKSAEIGYFIGEPFWGKGITSTAVKLMCNYGFATMDIVRIFTGVYEYNISSQRVLEKNGFIKEAVFKKSIFKNNALYDEVRYAKLKDNLL